MAHPKSLRKNRKGFFSAPLVGAIMFLIAASVVVYMNNENASQISLARSSESHNQMFFIAQAIRADAFRTLIQNAADKGTVEFLTKEGGHRVGEVDFSRSDMSRGLGEKMGEISNPLFGADLFKVYSDAYSYHTMRCNPVASRGYSTDSSRISNILVRKDGTFTVDLSALSHNINCVSSEPPGEVTINVVGSTFEVDIRVPRFYDIVQRAFQTAKTEIVKDEYAGESTSDKWYEVNSKRSNTIKTDGDGLPDPMNKLFDSWNRVIDNQFKNAVRREALQGKDRYWDLELSVKKANDRDEFVPDDVMGTDFVVVCEGGEDYKNCRPDEVTMDIGDSGCGDGIEFNKNIEVETGDSKLQGEISEIFEPLKHGCIIHQSSTEVCRKWSGKPRRVSFSSELTDRNPKYIPEFVDPKELKASFEYSRDVDAIPTLTVSKWDRDLLNCGYGGNNENQYLAKENAKKIAEGVEFWLRHYGRGWKPPDSNLVEVKIAGDTNLEKIYQDTHNTKEIMTLKVGGQSPSTRDYRPYYSQLNVNVKWDEAIEKCKEVFKDKDNVLCSEEVGCTPPPEPKCTTLDTGTLQSPNIKAFCEDLVRKGKVDYTCSCTFTGSPSDCNSPKEYSETIEITKLKFI